MPNAQDINLFKKDGKRTPVYNQHIELTNLPPRRKKGPDATIIVRLLNCKLKL